MFMQSNRTWLGTPNDSLVYGIPHLSEHQFFRHIFQSSLIKLFDTPFAFIKIHAFCRQNVTFFQIKVSKD